jgi:GT2 family glycosyltransferase
MRPFAQQSYSGGVHSMATVAAVIPHWNRRDLLDPLFASLDAQETPLDEIIVVDNGSSDDSVIVAERAGARVLRLGRNLGFAAAVNRGIEAAESDWVALLNNDVTLDPGWLSTLLEAASQQGAAFATGKILRADSPGIIDGAFDEISRGACACRCGSGKPDGPFWNSPRHIRFAPMTAALFRRDLFHELGPLDESYGSYLEDVDFGLRCALAGREGVYAPAAIAHHRGSATLGEWSPSMVRSISRNQTLLAAKYFSSQPRFPVLAAQLLWGLLALRHGCGWAYLRGKIEGIRAGAQIPEQEINARLAPILESSEKEILEVQRKTGFDAYWRIYFWLLRR